MANQHHKNNRPNQQWNNFLLHSLASGGLDATVFIHSLLSCILPLSLPWTTVSSLRIYSMENKAAQNMRFLWSTLGLCFPLLCRPVMRIPWPGLFQRWTRILPNHQKQRRIFWNRKANILTPPLLRSCMSYMFQMDLSSSSKPLIPSTRRDFRQDFFNLSWQSWRFAWISAPYAEESGTSQHRSHSSKDPPFKTGALKNSLWHSVVKSHPPCWNLKRPADAPQHRALREKHRAKYVNPTSIENGTI